MEISQIIKYRDERNREIEEQRVVAPAVLPVFLSGKFFSTAMIQLQFSNGAPMKKIQVRVEIEAKSIMEAFENMQATMDAKVPVIAKEMGSRMEAELRRRELAAGAGMNLPPTEPGRN